MKDGWVIKKLDEICNVFNGSTPLRRKKEFWDNGSINWFTIEDIRKQGRIINHTSQKITEIGYESSSLKLLPKKTILICCTASVGEYAITNIELTTNQQFNGLVVIDKKEVLPEYLFYFTSTVKKKLLNVSGKTTIDFVSIKKLKSLKIPIPPIEEQQQIVQILDEAFAKIDQAIANIEQNIKNAEDLFQSKLNQIFSQQGEGWEEKKLGEVLKLKSGTNLPAKKMITGDVPVYGGNGIAGYHNEANLEGKYVIIGRVGAQCGNVRFLDEKFWLTDNAFRVSEFKFDFDFRFLEAYLNYKNLRSFARQSAQPVISNSSLKNVMLSFPLNLETQKSISSNIESLSQRKDLIINKYESKLQNLEELKKSLLEKAFSGELIKNTLK
ncbi:MAG: hypothetical protein CMC13_11325 [Flavobacteriaceae bacterium]|nr:hypothetical protein [Flavobacteriaceae bacterium]|tara:strand:- start:4543 stop:5691 length:1149 start_codon:yes stop_codon:yes gene_type:complete